MAFLFRGKDKHLKILDNVAKENGISTKHKVLLFIVEQYEKVVAERDEYYQQMNKQRRELKALKAAIKATYDSERTLKELVGDETDETLIDRKT